MTSPSPPRQRWRRRERDAPPREAAEDDLSPPREARRREGPSGSPTRRGHRDPAPPGRWARRDLKAGLLTAKEFREEVRKIKRDEELSYAAMDPSLTGKGARPVFRNKQARRIRISEHQMLSGSADEHEPNTPTEEHGGLEWGTGGLAKRREAAARSRELQAERSRPFTRSKDDPELDAMQRSRARCGDPMAHLINKQAKEEESGAPRSLGDDEEMRGSGFVVPRDVPGNSWMRRGVDPPANRYYGVKPGRHWDGVDRGDGFESSGVTVERKEKKRPLWCVSES